jgi:hypothetical protein
MLSFASDNDNSRIDTMMTDTTNDNTSDEPMRIIVTTMNSSPFQVARKAVSQDLTPIGMLQEGDAKRDEDHAPNHIVAGYAVHPM